MATDITCQSGKGPRKHRNVSTKSYRAGWDRIFGKPAEPRYRILRHLERFIRGDEFQCHPHQWVETIRIGQQVGIGLVWEYRRRIS